MKKTYLVTGGAGFIGSHLVDSLLIDGYKVIVIDNFNSFYDVSLKERNVQSHFNDENYILERIDLRNQEDVKRVFDANHIDTVVHLAAAAGVRPSIEDPIYYQNNNCVSAQILLEEMRKHDVKKLVFASSSSVYGNNSKVPFKETDVVDYAISPYAATKKANEVMGHVYHSLFGMSMAFLRFFTVYGPRQRPDLAINKFTKLIMMEEEIPMYGDGSTSRDYTYVSDIVNGIKKAIKWVEENDCVYEIFNLGNSNPINLREMISAIENAVGKKAKIKQLPMQLGDVNRTYADISKANTVLKYQPKIDFQTGINQFVEWYQENEK